MSREDGGGPAFPSPSEQRYNDPIHGVIKPSDIYGNEGATGMTLRDYFAAKAFERLVDAHVLNAVDDLTRAEIAGEAYHYADAMLEARER